MAIPVVGPDGVSVDITSLGVDSNHNPTCGSLSGTKHDWLLKVTIAAVVGLPAMTGRGQFATPLALLTDV